MPAPPPELTIHRAEMTVYRPPALQPLALRPLAYAFGPDVFAELHTLLHQYRALATGADRLLERFHDDRSAPLLGPTLSDRPLLDPRQLGAVQPFCLTVDFTMPPANAAVALASHPTRLCRVGFLQGDLATPETMQLTITRTLLIPTFARPRLHDTPAPPWSAVVADQLHIDGALVARMAMDPVFDLRPSVLAAMVFEDMAITGRPLDAIPGRYAYPSSWEVPRQHSERLVRALLCEVDGWLTVPLTPSRTAARALEVGIGERAVADLHGHNPLRSGMPLATAETPTLHDLDTLLHGRLVVQPVSDTGPHAARPPGDPTLQSAAAVFATHIATVVTALLGQLAIHRVSGAYASTEDRLILYAHSFLAELSAEQEHRYLAALQTALCRQLFPTIEAARGAFRVNIDASIDGMTEVAIAFDDDDGEPHVYEHPSFLGGMVGGLLGTHQAVYNNLAVLTELLTQCLTE